MKLLRLWKANRKFIKAKKKRDYHEAMATLCQGMNNEFELFRHLDEIADYTTEMEEAKEELLK